MPAVGSIEMSIPDGVVFSMDLSGSMNLNAARNGLISYLNQSDLSSVALVSHSDYPGKVLDLTTGAQVTLGFFNISPPDHAFKIELPFVPVGDAVSYLPSLVSLNGGNDTEPYTRIVWEMSNAPTLNALGGTPTALVMFVDSNPHGYGLEDILDPGEIGDSAQNTVIPYTSPIYFDPSAQELQNLNCDLIVVRVGDTFGGGSFWTSRVGDEVTSTLDWSSLNVSTLIAYLNSVL